MVSAFQEVSHIGVRLFSEKSCFKPLPSKKLTVSQELLNEILAVHDYSIKKISEETTIPAASLYRIKSGMIKNPRSRTFQKILELYCRVCQ
jgi:hypothetical protein